MPFFIFLWTAMTKRFFRRRIKMTPAQLAEWMMDVAAIEDEKLEFTRWANDCRKEVEAQRETLAAALRKAREDSGLTLEELQEKTGIGKSQLSRLLSSGGKNPTLNTLHRIAGACGRKLVVTLTEK